MKALIALIVGFAAAVTVCLVVAPTAGAVAPRSKTACAVWACHSPIETPIATRTYTPHAR